MPWVKRYPNFEPHRDLVVWVGMHRFDYITIELLGYFPDDLAWYEERLGQGTQTARLVHYAYSAWNKDMRYFIEGKRMRPELAADEVRAIWQGIFRSMVGAVNDVVGNLAGANIGARISSNAAQTMGEVLESFRNSRRLFSLAQRRARPLIALFRGTTQRLKFGDPTYAVEHDLGRGLYFSDSEGVAAIYAAERGTATDPAVILQAQVELSQLGNVLDLVDGPLAAQWQKQVADFRRAYPNAPFINTNYRSFLEGFLETLGHKLDDFDTIIAQEYRTQGKQICIKSEAIIDQILKTAQELYR
jgi:hypothetical protein